MIPVQVEAQFLDVHGRRVTAPVKALAGEPLEERGSVWEPGSHRGRRGIATWWWAATTGKLVGCASLERQRAAVELDFDPAVVAFSGWPVRLAWTSDGERHELVADFVARTRDGGRALVVCPPGLWEPQGTGPGWDEVEQVLQEACRRAGWQLRLPRPGSRLRTANLLRAAHYRHPRHRDPETEQALLAAFARPRPLQEGAAASGLPTASALKRAYHLVWAQLLRFDWEQQPLLPTSIVAAAGGVR